MFSRQKVAIAARRLAVVGLAVSSLAIAYQLIAYAVGYVPDHIMPLVILLSGTEQAVPVAYSWTVLAALLSAAVFAASGLVILAIRFTLHRGLRCSLCLLPFFISGCSKLPSKTEIGREFLATEPVAKIIDIRHTEGDSEHIYYDIEFTRGSAADILVCELGARATADGRSYTIFHRATRTRTVR